MIRTATINFFASAAFLAALPAVAQEAMPHEGHQAASSASPACTAPGTFPPALAGWGQPHGTLTAAARPGAVRRAVLVPGHAVDATLLPTPDVRYAVAPAKPGGSVSFGGSFAFDVAEAGTYRVALSTHSWIDVIEGNVALQSVAHGHGPACTTLAKMVDYPLKPGRHVLQVAANGEAAISLMVAKLP